MNLSPVGATSASMVNAASGAERSQRKSSLTQEDFLSLLMTQMQYQDPLSPMDNNQMSAQMAQLGTIEGINKLTQTLETMSAYQASTAHLQLAGLIGKKVEAMGNLLVAHQGNATEGSYQLSRPGRVSIGIYDGKGNLVRTVEDGLKDTAKQRFIWDGKNQIGETVPDGTYTFKVKAVDVKGESIPVSSSMIGTVSGISFENGVTYINIGSERIALSDIFAILS
jgi:flagellar basal-body rod modification protein FlgD